MKYLTGFFLYILTNIHCTFLLIRITISFGGVCLFLFCFVFLLFLCCSCCCLVFVVFFSPHNSYAPISICGFGKDSGRGHVKQCLQTSKANSGVFFVFVCLFHLKYMPRVVIGALWKCWSRVIKNNKLDLWAEIECWQKLSADCSGFKDAHFFSVAACTVTSSLVSISFFKMFLFLHGNLYISFPVQLAGPRLLPTFLVEIMASWKEKEWCWSIKPLIR